MLSYMVDGMTILDVNNLKLKLLWRSSLVTCITTNVRRVLACDVHESVDDLLADA